MGKKKILFIGGSLNQTSMLHKISMHLEDDYDCYFTYYYADGFIGLATKLGLADFTVLGGKFKQTTINYFKENDLKTDFEGKANDDYELVVTSSDLIIQKNIKNRRILHVQEGMTDPENFAYYLAKYLGFPRWMASTSTTGMSDAYDVFCVASEGYKELFTRKGASPEKLVVTGIPNFDNAARHLDNDFPHKGYVLVATSDARETFKYENRKKFIYECAGIADGRPMIFKLHPNERYDRAAKEIKEYAPEGTLVFQEGNTDHMIANCDVLITKYSSVVYIGIALGKEVHSYFDLEMLKKLTPIQNGGTSAEKIALVAQELLEQPEIDTAKLQETVKLNKAVEV